MGNRLLTFGITGSCFDIKLTWAKNVPNAYQKELDSWCSFFLLLLEIKILGTLQVKATINLNVNLFEFVVVNKKLTNQPSKNLKKVTVK